MRGALLGMLGLAALETLLSNQNGVTVASGILSLPAMAVSWFIDPTVPAVPNLTDPANKWGPGRPSLLGAPAGQPTTSGVVFA